MEYNEGVSTTALDTPQHQAYLSQQHQEYLVSQLGIPVACAYSATVLILSIALIVISDSLVGLRKTKVEWEARKEISRIENTEDIEPE